MRASKADSNFALELLIRRRRRARPHAVLVDRIEQQRRLIEQIEQKREHADDQHEHLQRNLPDRRSSAATSGRRRRDFAVRYRCTWL